LARELLPKLYPESIRGREREMLKNFDQWTEELSKQVVIRSDEEEMKTLWKANENLADDDFEEEE
jgi:hypothetical protein